MANPYASTGSVSTVAASLAGGARAGERSVLPGDGAPASAWEVLRRLAPYLGHRAPLLALGAACAVAGTIMQLVVPLIIGSAIDLLVGPGRVDMAGLLVRVLALGLVVAFSAALQWAQGFVLNRLCASVAADMRVAAQEKLLRLDVLAIDAHAHGDYVSRVVNDVDQIGDGLMQGTTQLVCGVATIVGTLACMCSVSVWMALVVMCATPLSLVAAALIARLSSKGFAAQQELQGRVSAHIEEYVGNQQLVRAFGYAPVSQAEFERMNDELRQVGERAQFVSSLSNPGTRFVNNLIYAVVAVVGCLCCMTGWPAPLTVGGVQVFLSYANQYTKPFSDLTGVLSQIQTAFASARRFLALMALSERVPDASGAVDLKDPRGRIDFEGVRFGYDPQHPVLDDVTFTVMPGQRVVLVGATGCGKTTLINVLMGFLSPQAGTVCVDGVDTRRITSRSLRASLGMVLQDSWIFTGTVAQNIAYGRPDATRDEVRAACAMAHADGFVSALPQGLDTVIGDGGMRISQGQAQLVSIARVMLAAPPILLLDEATSSIDSRTEAQVGAAFDELMAGRTSLVVAHRLSTVRDADTILVMDAGRIVERGTHEELLALGGAYAALYRSQWG